MKKKLRYPIIWLPLILLLAVGPSLSSSFAAGFNPREEFDGVLPGALYSLGINGKESTTYSNLAKVASQALKKNLIPFVDAATGGRPVLAEEVVEDFTTYCLDSDFSDKVAWRRGARDMLWLQFSCVKDGEFPAIRERLFVLTVSPEFAKPIDTNLSTQWNLIDLRLLSANIEPGSKLELTPTSNLGMKSPVARAAVAISGAVLLSTFVASRTMPNQQDKVLHSGVSGVLAAGAAAYFHFVQDMSPEKSALTGGAVSLLIGAGKEALDPTWGGNRSKQDMKANMIGAALGTVTVYLSFKFN